MTEIKGENVLNISDGDSNALEGYNRITILNPGIRFYGPIN
jgi:hypothetical protein